MLILILILLGLGLGFSVESYTRFDVRFEIGFFVTNLSALCLLLWFILLFWVTVRWIFIGKLRTFYTFNQNLRTSCIFAMLFQIDIHGSWLTWLSWYLAINLPNSARLFIKLSHQHLIRIFPIFVRFRDRQIQSQIRIFTQRILLLGYLLLIFPIAHSLNILIRLIILPHIVNSCKILHNLYSNHRTIVPTDDNGKNQVQYNHSNG